MSVTERDYELISAYLDGQLTDIERSDLESRLQTDPELQREFQSLRQTVALIRQLPERPAPRNFTLDPRAFGKPALPFPLTITFSALSTAAAVLLFAFGGYFLLQTGTLEQAASTSSIPQQQSAAQNLAPTREAAIAALPTATALPTQTMPPATPAAQPSATVEVELESQMAQMADTESDETAASAPEPAADATGPVSLFSTGEGAQAHPAGEALEESRDLAEAPATFDDSAASSGMGGGARATAAAPPLAVPLPTSVAALKSSDTPETIMRAVPDAIAEVPADGAGADEADTDNEGTVGRVDDRLRQESPTGVDSRGMIGLGLLAAGALLLAAAIVTTIVRQRRLRP